MKLIIVLLFVIVGASCILSNVHSEKHHDTEHSKSHHDRKHIEHAKIHHNVRHVNHRHLLHKHKRNHISNRDNENSTCNNTDDLRIFYNGTTGLLGFNNETGHTSLIFNLSSSGIVIIFDGLNGTAFVWNSSDPNPIQLSNVWFFNETFGIFFNSLSSSGLSSAGAVNSSSDVNAQVTKLAANFGINGNATTAALRNYSRLVNEIGRTLLNGFHFQSQCIRGGLNRFFAILRLLARLLRQSGSFSGNSTNIDFFAISNARNSLQVFVAIINAFSSYGNVSQEIEPYIKDAPSFSALLVQFIRQNYTDGVDQYFQLIYYIDRAAGQGEYSGLFNTLLTLPKGRLNVSNADLTGPIQNWLRGQQNTSSQLQNVINILQNLTGNNVPINGVNVTSFFNSVRNANSTNDTFTATIGHLYYLGNLLNSTQIFTNLTRYTIHLFANPGSFAHLLPLFPGFSQLQNFNFTNLTTNPAALEQIPFFANYSRLINSIVSSLSNGSVNLGNFLNLSGSGNFIISNPIASGFVYAIQTAFSIADEFFGGSNSNGNSETTTLPSTEPSIENTTVTDIPDSSSSSPNDTENKRHYANKHHGVHNKIHPLHLKHSKHHEAKKHGAQEEKHKHINEKHAEHEKHNKQPAGHEKHNAHPAGHEKHNAHPAGHEKHNKHSAAAAHHDVQA